MVFIGISMIVKIATPILFVLLIGILDQLSFEKGSRGQKKTIFETDVQFPQFTEGA